MRDKIAESLFEIDAWGISFDDLKANPNFKADLDGYYRRADAILALEVRKKLCESDGVIYTSNPPKCKCKHCGRFWRIAEKRPPACTRSMTIGDLIG